MHIICTNLTIFYTDKHLYSSNTHFLHSLTPNINNIRFVFLEYNYKTINTRRVVSDCKKTPPMNSIIMGAFTYRVFWVMTFTTDTAM